MKNLPLSKQRQLDGYESSADPKDVRFFDNQSEGKIWSAFKAGSETALVYIYDKFYVSLYNYASQFTSDRDLIKDAIHDLFIELINKRQKLSDTTSIKYYLLKAVKSKLINLIKREKKIEYKEDLLNGCDFQLSFSTQQILIERQISDDKKKEIEMALHSMTRKQRQVIYLYYFEELTIGQVAGIMGFSNEKSAQNLLYKSLKILKDKVLIFCVLMILHLVLKN